MSKSALVIHPRHPVTEKAGLEVIRRWLEGVVRGEFIDSLYGVDELRDRWRCSKVSDPLRLHDVLDGVFVLNEGYDTHLSFALGAL